MGERQAKIHILTYLFCDCLGNRWPNDPREGCKRVTQSHQYTSIAWRNVKMVDAVTSYRQPVHTDCQGKKNHRTGRGCAKVATENEKDCAGQAGYIRVDNQENKHSETMLHVCNL